MEKASDWEFSEDKEFPDYESLMEYMKGSYNHWELWFENKDSHNGKKGYEITITIYDSWLE